MRLRRKMKMRERILAVATGFVILVVTGLVSPCLAHMVGDDIDIKPKTLGSVCKRESITVTWDMPDGCVPEDIVPETVIISNIGGDPVSLGPASHRFKRHGDDWHLLLKYDCSEVLDVIITNDLRGEVVIEISGTLSDGTSFIGWDDIHVKRKRAQ
jgi:hypothetical protein